VNACEACGNEGLHLVPSRLGVPEHRWCVRTEVDGRLWPAVGTMVWCPGCRIEPHPLVVVGHDADEEVATIRHVMRDYNVDNGRTATLGRPWTARLLTPQERKEWE